MELSTLAEPPTFYANVVTASVDPDAVYLELRRLIIPHRDMYANTKTGGAAPPSDEATYALDPIARVVITYTAAKALQATLNELVPKMQLARKEPVGT